MPKVEQVTEINAPIERVWYLMSDAGGIPPFKSKGTRRITEFRSMTMNLEIELTETDSGIGLLQRIDLKSKWWMRPLAML